MSGDALRDFAEPMRAQGSDDANRRVVAVNMARYDQALCTEAGARADNPLPFMMRILHAAQDRSRPAVPLLFRG
jgi:hypothetical protein